MKKLLKKIILGLWELNSLIAGSLKRTAQSAN
jgi:hypothetical protein